MALAASAAINTVPDFTRKIFGDRSSDHHETSDATSPRHARRVRPSLGDAGSTRSYCSNGGGLRQAELKKG